MNTRHVLIVDDDPNLTKVLSNILKARGYSPTAVSTGRAALERIEEEPPGVALIDLRLDDMSGLEVMQGIKERSSGTECIVLTGHASQASAIEAINLGAYSYLQKPYNAELLLVTIRRAMERREAEEALQKSEASLTQAQHIAHVGSWTLDLETNEQLWSQETYRIFGVSPEDFGASQEAFLDCVHPEDREALLKAAEDALNTREPYQVEHRIVRPDGEVRIVIEQAEVSTDESGHQILVGTVQDITERKRAEEERENLQAQLLQSQKMEAVGQLTAGIAHDFNNLLTAINGFAQLIQLRLAPDDPTQEMVGRIWDSGQRAAGLVAQLMAFSRKQIIDPRVLDLNAVVADLDDMLRRVIREDVELEMVPAPDLWPVKVDPTQMEQVIVNLVVNAADAMPNGGRLTIETSSVVLDEDYLADHPEAEPGEHVLLAVSDTGVGMSPEVQAHIFEPFFTTKERGEGTGLGLATVYGGVQQNGGHISVYSQEGQGTTFKIYLPRAEESAELSPRGEGAKAMPAGGETILLVEDEAELRELARQVLENQGYTLLEAGDGPQALDVASSHAGPIHLLLTDVIMPGMSGSTLSERLVQGRPDVRVLYMSGYADDTIKHHGVLEKGTAFLQKPFNPLDLARKVRAVLDE